MLTCLARLACAGLSPSVARADATAAGPSNVVHVQVRGTTQIAAHASRASGHIVVSGTVTDDVGHPDPTARVILGFSRDSSSGGASVGATVSLSGAAPEACATPTGTGAAGALPPVPALLGPDRIVVALDAQGRFCERLLLDPARYTAHVDAPGTAGIDGAKLDLPVDLTVPPLAIVALAFDPPKTVLSLDEPAVDVDLVASIDEEGVTRGAPGLPLVLSNESGSILGEATTAPSGRATVRVASARLGAMGPGELRASFSGSSSAGASASTLAVERRARVDLSVADAERAGASLHLLPGNPEEGVTVRVTAAARCASAGCTGVASGAVEARVGDAVVGAAALDHGQASLVVTFARPAASEVPLHLRYLPDAPWLTAGDDLEATLPVQGPSPLRRALLAMAGLATVVWLYLGRAGILRAASGTASKLPGQGSRQVVAHVEVLATRPADRGWTGIVVDAHDDSPLAGARVAIERRGFERMQLVTEARSAQDGRFELAPVDCVPGDEIVAEGPLHAVLREAAPGSGDLRVALVLRRRAVLDRLVTWARKRGKPFDARPEPTPGHVRRAAGGDSPVGRWADAVERAAFGGETLDMRAHAELEKLSPASAEAPEGPSNPQGPQERRDGERPRAR